MANISTVFMTVVLLAISLRLAEGHGYLLDPPSRSSMWRFGFDVPINWSDMGLNCGGQDVQHNEINQGRCGECGDPYNKPRPRDNDEGGTYGTGIISKTYIEGSEIILMVNLTVTHFGYFEFRLCPKNSAGELVTQECLDRYPLQVIDHPGQGNDVTVKGTRFTIAYGSNEYHFFPKVKLPAGVTCDNCVLQWYWTTGNSPDQDCSDGTIGFCKQESFVNCADIAIVRQ